MRPSFDTIYWPLLHMTSFYKANTGSHLAPTRPSMISGTLPGMLTTTSRLTRKAVVSCATGRESMLRLTPVGCSSVSASLLLALLVVCCCEGCLRRDVFLLSYRMLLVVFKELRVSCVFSPVLGRSMTAICKIDLGLVSRRRNKHQVLSIQVI